MITMRNLLILCLLCFMGGCGKDENGSNKDEPVGDLRLIHLQSYIIRYIDAPIELFASIDGKEVITIGPSEEKYTIYQCAEIGGNKDSAEGFLEISKQKGDISYDRKDYFLNYMIRDCYVNDFQKIKVVCLNQDLDAKHPRGSDLGDITIIRLRSYRDYIHNGYKGEEFKDIKKYVTDLTPEDLTLFCVWKTTLQFENPLTPGKEYEMQVTIVTTEGEENTATCKISL